MGFAVFTLALLSLFAPAFAGGGGAISGCGRRLVDAAGDEVVDASSRRRSTVAAGADDPWCGEFWWEEEHEYSYMESYMVVSLVGLALLFEAAHHFAHHSSHRAYIFGTAWDERRHEASHADVQHSLLADLVSRATSEFTVLGFLAFVIWCTARAGGFEEIAYRMGPGEEGARLPRMGSEYLHMLEDVHMHLFVGMVFYFSFMCQLVCATFRTLRGWETRDISCGLCDVSESGLLENAATEAPGYPRFSAWRKYFFASLVECKGLSPDGWAELECFCEWREGRRPPSKQGQGEQTTQNAITADFTQSQSADAPRVSKSALAADMDQTMQAEAMRVVRCLDDWFPFGKYLAMNARVVVEDMIDFNLTTWLATALLMILSGLLSKFLHTNFQELLPYYVGFTILVFVAMCVCLFTWERHVGEIHRWHKCLYSLHRKVPIEVFSIHVLQVLLFYVSYGTSRMVASVHEWEYYFWENVMLIIVFLSIHVLFAAGVADIIVYSAGLWSVGELMSDDNFMRLVKILEKRREGGRQSQLAHLDPHVEHHHHDGSEGHAHAASHVVEIEATRVPSSEDLSKTDLALASATYSEREASYLKAAGSKVSYADNDTASI